MYPVFIVTREVANGKQILVEMLPYLCYDFRNRITEETWRKSSLFETEKA